MGSSVTDSRRPGILSATVALAALAVACATTPNVPLLLHPVPPTVQRYSLSQGAIVFSGPDFIVSTRPWDYRLVAEECRSSGEPCPFGDDEAAVGRFIFFRVRLENHSARTLVFNPMRASLLREGEAPLVPLENSDLFMFAKDEHADAEARGRVFRRMSFDGAVTLRPGQEIERYLAFRSPKELASRFVLEIADLWLDAKAFDLYFTFEAFPGK